MIYGVGFKKVDAEGRERTDGVIRDPMNYFTMG